MIGKINNKMVIILVSVMVAIILILILNYNKKSDVVIENIEDNEITEKEIEIEKEKQIIIHITGCIKNQGIIEIKEGARIADAIEAAGGITEDADIEKVNLAYIVKDSQKIYIPSIYDKDDTEYISIESGNNVVIEDKKKGEKNMVNINSATQTELEQLPGIGPSTALKIINYREKNGKFKTIEEIKEIPGIGDSKFNNIKDNIEV